VAKGDAANPVLVASAEPLCKVYHDHLIALGRLRLGAVMCAYSGAASSRSRLELAKRVEDFTIEHLVRGTSIEVSMWPFSYGLPGSMEAVFAPTEGIHCRTALATNSVP
jgi:hypothetical protein